MVQNIVIQNLLSHTRTTYYGSQRATIFTALSRNSHIGRCVARHALSSLIAGMASPRAADTMQCPERFDLDLTGSPFRSSNNRSTLERCAPSLHSRRCVPKVLRAIQHPIRQDGGRSLSRYLAAVYRDPAGIERLGLAGQIAFAAGLGWRYHESPQLQPYANLSCVLMLHHWNSSWDQCGCHEDGIEGILLRPGSDLVEFNRYGVWLPAGTAHCTRHPQFTQDHQYTEVTRTGGRATTKEHGAAGCWYLRAKGSGVFLNANRTLKVRSRAEMAIELGLHKLNSTTLFTRNAKGQWNNWTWSQVKDEMDRTFPWMLEGRLNLCPHVRRAGFDTVQLWDETTCGGDGSSAQLAARGMACLPEILSCHDACMALKTRRASWAGCVKNQPLRTGLNAQLECMCNASKRLVNCDLTAPQLPSVLVADGGRLAETLKVTRSGCRSCATRPSRVL